MTIRKANTGYMFDQHIKSGDGELVGIQIEIWNAEMEDVYRGCTHVILGHPSGHITKMTAKYLDLNKMELDKICQSYIRGKQCQEMSQNRQSS